VHDAPPLDDYPKTVVLTDGMHVVLRPCTPGDRALMEVLRGRVGISEARRIREPGPGVVVILAVAGERVAGALTLERDDGALQIALDPDYYGRRLGTWMLLDAVHLATDLGMGQLVVRTGAGDEALRGALDRLDFQSEMVGRDGDVTLRKALHRGWPDF
jgi:GNAT superfamily N-acetyltransferase